MYIDHGEGTLLIRRGTKEEIEELEKRYKKALNEVLNINSFDKEKKIREHLQDAGFENDVIDKLIDVLNIDDAYENLMKNKYWKERGKKVDNNFAI